jgi:hypothetical protein
MLPVVAAMSATEIFHVTLVQPEGHLAAEALRPTAEAFFFALRRLGFRVYLGTNRFLHDATNVVVGAHLLDAAVAATLPSGTIVFNSEPLDPDGANAAALAPFAARSTVWDYHAYNVTALRAMGAAAVEILQIGYLPEFERVVHQEHKDVAVLFFGQLSPHRRSVLEAIEARGVAPVWLHEVYGEIRDGWIGRSRIVLNLDKEPGAPPAIGRIVYLMANRCVVISEAASPASIDVDLVDGLVAVPAAQVAGAVIALLADPARCARLAARAHELVMRRDFSRSVQHLLSRRSATPRSI